MEAEDAYRYGNPDAVISAIYDGTLNPENYQEFIKAWDAYFTRPTTETLSHESPDYEGLEKLEFHFKRAARIFQQMDKANSTNIKSLLDAFKFGAFVINESGNIVCNNVTAQGLFLAAGIKNIFDYDFYDDAVRNVQDFIHKNIHSTSTEPAQFFLVGEDPVSKEKLAFVLEPIHIKNDNEIGDKKAAILVKTTTLGWSEKNEEMLKFAFGLTQAEVEIIRLLIAGLSHQEIANIRERSRHTIKSQSKAILQKTGMKSQASLLKLVTTMFLISSPSNRDMKFHGTLNNTSTDTTVHWKKINLRDGRTLQYVISGERSGKPVLFIQPSTRPDFSTKVRAVFAKNNLSVFSPVRPGVWGSSAIPGSWKINKIIEDYIELLKQLNLKDITLVGYCSGGLYALELAKRLPGLFRKLILLDTGAPLDSISKIKDMPTTQRRTFLTARLTPWVLVVPHWLVWADFRSGKDGEARTVKYFYTDSPVDEARMRDGEYFEITRNNIDFCFQNVPLLVSDISAWSNDWTDLLKDVCSKQSVLFIHGSENKMFPAADLIKISNTQPNIDIKIIEGAAQTLLYTHIEEFVTALT